jgi:hypothetical protein
MKTDIIGRIYMVYSLESPFFLPYYSSTLGDLDSRLNTHKSAFTQFLKGKMKLYIKFRTPKKRQS